MTYGINADSDIWCLYFAIWRDPRVISRRIVATSVIIITKSARFDIDADYFDELKIPENLSIVHRFVCGWIVYLGFP